MPDCPRCSLKLQTEVYEENDVLFCTNCWGHWVSFPAFAAILQNEVYSFSKSDTESVLRKWAGQEGGSDLTSVIRCPDCDQEMRQMNFADDCPVLVDRCDDHGVWLDCAEIKEIQVFLDALRQT